MCPIRGYLELRRREEVPREPTYACFQNKFVNLSEAKLGAMTNFLHYGTGVFEGIRGNWNDKKGKVFLFCLEEHYERLHKGCQILKIDLPYSVEKMCQITVELVKKCAFKEDVY